MEIHICYCRASKCQARRAVQVATLPGLLVGMVLSRHTFYLALKPTSHSRWCPSTSRLGMCQQSCITQFPVRSITHTHGLDPWARARTWSLMTTLTEQVKNAMGDWTAVNLKENEVRVLS